MTWQQAITTLAAILAVSHQLSAETNSGDFVLVTAPSGEFQLMSKAGGGALWLKPLKNGKEAIALPPVEVEVVKAAGEIYKVTRISSDAIESEGRCFISPDNQWIFANLRVTDSGMAGLLYRRSDDRVVIRFEAAIPDGFEKRAWQFYGKEAKVSEASIGIPNRYGIRGKDLTFGAWSADSARLLISLSGTVGEPKEPADGGPTKYDSGPSQWLCYFNTRTGAFEQTARLLKANARKSDKQLVDDKAPEPNAILSAESFGQESLEVSAPDRFKKADSELNNSYQLLSKSLPSDQQAQLRDEQRAWLGVRETFAAIHANQSWSPFPNASRVEGAAIATETRVAELQRRLDSTKERPK